MHFEILIEDQSGKAALESLMPKILGEGSGHSFRIHPYKGIGRIPQGMRPGQDPSRRLLLTQLPRLLKGYGYALQGVDAVVVIVVDVDDRNCIALKEEIMAIARRCRPAPRVLVRIAIEELEAWLLGDRGAVRAAYPRAKAKVLARYAQDSICGTWEVLADVLHPGGAKELKTKGWPAPGQAKFEWASRIAPHMNVEANESSSFRAFRDGIRRLLPSETR